MSGIIVSLELLKIFYRGISFLLAYFKRFASNRIDISMEIFQKLKDSHFQSIWIFKKTWVLSKISCKSNFLLKNFPIPFIWNSKNLLISWAWKFIIITSWKARASQIPTKRSIINLFSDFTEKSSKIPIKFVLIPLRQPVRKVTVNFLKQTCEQKQVENSFLFSLIQFKIDFHVMSPFSF